MKQIAVLLTVFNRKEKTLLCLKNLYQQTLPNEYRIDIYLTNDGCTDGTPEAARAIPASEHHKCTGKFILEPRNAFSMANSDTNKRL